MELRALCGAAPNRATIKESKRNKEMKENKKIREIKELKIKVAPESSQILTIPPLIHWHPEFAIFPLRNECF